MKNVLKKVFQTRYRIVEEKPGRFVCERRFWFWPWYFELDFWNLSFNIEEAQQYLDNYRHPKRVVQVV